MSENSPELLKSCQSLDSEAQQITSEINIIQTKHVTMKLLNTKAAGKLMDG